MSLNFPIYGNQIVLMGRCKVGWMREYSPFSVVWKREDTELLTDRQALRVRIEKVGWGEISRGGLVLQKYRL